METLREEVKGKDLPEIWREKAKVKPNEIVMVIIQPVSVEQKEDPAESIDAHFLETIQALPVADDLPQDLAHQHDHYLYQLPKKP